MSDSLVRDHLASNSLAVPSIGLGVDMCEPFLLCETGVDLISANHPQADREQ